MPRQNDVGTLIEVQIMENGEVFSIPDGAVLKIRLGKPNGQVVTRTAELLTDGSDGWIRYVSVEGDFDQVGMWEVEGYVEYSGNKYSSEIGAFEVKRILKSKNRLG